MSTSDSYTLGRDVPDDEILRDSAGVIDDAYVEARPGAQALGAATRHADRHPGLVRSGLQLIRPHVHRLVSSRPAVLD